MSEQPAGPDPRFPDHAHFRLLADTVKEVDEQIQGPEELCKQENIDQNSLTYFLSERAYTVVREMGAIELSMNLPATVAAAMHDGFALGYLFALNRTDR